jgi:hypothetical protein
MHWKSEKEYKTYTLTTDYVEEAFSGINLTGKFAETFPGKIYLNYIVISLTWSVRKCGTNSIARDSISSVFKSNTLRSTQGYRVYSTGQARALY